MIKAESAPPKDDIINDVSVAPRLGLARALVAEKSKEVRVHVRVYSLVQ